GLSPVDVVAGAGRIDREHRAASVREVHLALAVRNEHPMRAQEVGAEQHVRSGCRASRDETFAPEGRELPDIGEPDRGIAYELVPDAEALERAEPVFHHLLPETSAAARRAHTRAFRLAAKRGRVRFRYHRRKRAGIEKRRRRPAVDLDSELDTGRRFEDGAQFDGARALRRPVRERLARTITRL